MPPKNYKVWIKRQRDALILQLGGKCDICGSTQYLEFDHPNGRDYMLTRTSQHGRIARYKREAKEGLLRLLCRQCNASMGNSRRRGKDVNIVS